jgi:hypothetical protein
MFLAAAGVEVSPTVLIGVALVALVGTPLGGVGAALITTRATRAAQRAATKDARQAQADAVQAQLATVRAQADAARAQTAAAEAATELVRTARAQTAQLDDIQKTTVATHTIVNSQRTKMLELMASLARRVADDHLDDPLAQRAAEIAEKDAADAGT